ncbi:hypothetical protein N5D28_13325 [Stutzerimonas stutzeri]|uniref:hypothetical protein n=1 Tax=Stutzerimonas stutzeri TaxID=316 RepID=UPI0024481226|nr:hypothetical protein [Stutzerimonas stutzeri]MDH0609858.1 hypothetical protein [Stutzerimonas stutzeri]
MSDRLPDDLPGGWEHVAEFEPHPLAVGQVWRKMGPIDALRIERVMLPGNPQYDGGAPGISVRRTVYSHRVKWSKDTGFWGGSQEMLHKRLEEGGYSLANPSNPNTDEQVQP